MAVINPFDFFLEPYAERFPFAYEPPCARAGALSHHAEPAGAAPARVSGRDRRASRRASSTSWSSSTSGSQRDVRYLIRMEPGVQTPEETLELARGSCRDSGWLLVQLLRHLGLAARFVSGYLSSSSPTCSRSRVRRDRRRTSPICTPGARSICRARAGSASIRPPVCSPARGISPSPARPSPRRPRRSPVRVGSAKSEFDHAMQSTRICEAPRVTKPYAEKQWQRHRRAGRRVDTRSRRAGRASDHGRRADLRLDRRPRMAQNGIPRPSGPRNDGWPAQLYRPPARALCAGGLTISDRASGIPGEPLPRWSLNCYLAPRRRAVWGTTERCSRDERRMTRWHGRVARRFLAAARRGDSVSPDIHVRRATRMPSTTCGVNGACPRTSIPLESRLSDPQERARLARSSSKVWSRSRATCCL